VRGYSTAMASVAGSEEGPLEAWLEKHGRGRVSEDRQQELRSLLLSDLETRGFARGGNAGACHEEVEKFLQNGHVSGSNLSRLERRVLRRMHMSNAPASARQSEFGGSSVISDFTKASGGAMSARAPSSQARSVLRGVPEDLLSVTGEKPRSMLEQNPEIYKWSEIAKHSKLLEDREKVAKREKIKTSQEKIRLELEEQIREKERKEALKKIEDKANFHRMEEELAKWKESEDLAIQEQKKAALEVKKDREVQVACYKRLRDEEKMEKLEQDRRFVKKAQAELEEEQTLAAEKKKRQKDAMYGLLREWEEGRAAREEAEKVKRAEEKKKVKEYQQMLEDQEERNRQARPPPRQPAGEYSPPDKAQRRREEKRRDEMMMKVVKEANKKAAEEQQRKNEQRSVDLQHNQEFLFSQMHERDAKKREELEQRDRQKQIVQDETREYMEIEKQRIEQRRMKNIQHRLELEKQISMKKASPKVLNAEDTMSQAERAINRILLQEAQELRKQADMSSSF